jgi:hypothetical protein
MTYDEPAECAVSSDVAPIFLVYEKAMTGGGHRVVRIDVPSKAVCGVEPSSISPELITICSKREGTLGKNIQLSMPRKIEPLFTRVSAVKDGLLAAHKAGSGSPNEVIGNEREVFIRN